MIIKEFRIVLPLTVEEYQAAQLYAVAEASKAETGGGEGITILKNEPFNSTEGIQPTSPLLNGQFNEGQYTHKIFHIGSKIPRYLLWFAPKGSLQIHEEAWNAYPYCRTILTNPDYLKDSFIIKVESIHLPDRGETENPHGLDAPTLRSREVVWVDIAHDPYPEYDYKLTEDPRTFKSEKTRRGPLDSPNWQKEVEPVMTCYKLVTVEFKWWGLQSRLEKAIQKGERRLFTKFHRQVFCSVDSWFGLSMADIRAHEERTKEELAEQLHTGPVRGMKQEEAV
jgi:hypothetical protein